MNDELFDMISDVDHHLDTLINKDSIYRQPSKSVRSKSIIPTSPSKQSEQNIVEMFNEPVQERYKVMKSPALLIAEQGEDFVLETQSQKQLKERLTFLNKLQKLTAKERKEEFQKMNI